MKYVFSANPGRSGSGYLYKLFSTSPDVCAVHEPAWPENGQGKALVEWNKGNRGPMRDVVARKIESMERLRKGRIYLETNNAFVKGFGQELLAMVPPEDVGVVVLHRARSKVIDSLVATGHVPGNPVDHTWLLHPGWPENLVPDPEDKSPEGLCGWYHDEVYARWMVMSMDNPDVRHDTYHLDELNTEDGVVRLYGFLGVTMPHDIVASIGAAYNARPT